jgi:TetR/AcrR family tetracycline transcriptional repressor
VPKAAVEARRRRGQLSRTRILSAALELVDQDGLDALTMRRLADELQVDPMSIYGYVPGKEALLDGLTEALWSEVRLPEGARDWKETLRTFASSLRRLAHAHPQAYHLLLGRGTLPGPALHAMDVALLSLEAAGLGREQAAEMIRTLVAYGAGYAMLELACPPPGGDTELEQLVALTRALAPDSPARLVEVARLMATCDMDYQFDLGLELILTGLEARLR